MSDSTRSEVSGDRQGADRRARWLAVARAGLRGLAWVAAAVVSLWSVHALLTTHLPAGHRTEFHAVRVLLVSDLWQDGNLVPRWVPELAGGLGYPLFVYYGWLSYALAAELDVIGLSPVTAMNVVTVAAMLWQAAGAWLLGRELGGRAGGWIAWALFAFAPYQLMNVFVRGNFPEVVAGSFGPWALFAVVRAVRGRDRWSLPLGAILLAAIILSHNISGLTLGATVTAAGLLVAATLPPGSRRLGAMRALAAAAAGVLAAAIFWLPILAYRHEAQLSRDFGGYLDYRQHFLYPRQLLSTAWDYGISVAGPDDTMPLHLGIAQVAVVVVVAPLVVVLAGRGAGRRRARVAGFALGAALLAFLTTSWSAPLWTILSPLATLQFPWRLHLPGTLLVAATGALAVRALTARAGRRSRIAGLDLAAGLAATLAVALASTQVGHCQPPGFYRCGERCVRQLLASGYYTTAIHDEFRPAAATDLAAVSRVLRTGQAMLDGEPVPGTPLPPPVERGDFAIRARLDHGGELLLPVFWFPGWQVIVDGRPRPAYPCTGSGALCMRLDAGEHRIAARWRPTTIYHVGTVITLLTLVVLAVSLRRWPRKKKTDGHREGSGADGGGRASGDAAAP